MSKLADWLEKAANRLRNGGKSSDLPKEYVDRVSSGVDYRLPNEAADGWMGPGQPINPVAQDVRGRTWDFPVGSNVVITPRQYEAVTAAQLRGLADNCDILRLVIETRKDQIEAFDWEVVPADDAKPTPENMKECEKWAQFLLRPSTEDDFATWIRKALDDLFVIDAVAIIPRMTRGGELYSLDIADGATFKRVIDDKGLTPVPPDPAYQQVLKNVPAVDFHVDELAYFMRNPRTYKLYGYSPVEQIMITVNTAIRKAMFQLQYFTEGNVPEAIAGLPETWTMQEVRDFQDYWDSILEGNTGQRRHMKFVPLDPTKIKETKQQDLKDMYDEWLARVVCFAFSIAPTPFVKDHNRATAQTNAEQSKLEGLAPLMKWIRNKINFMLRKWGGMNGVEFRWKMDEAVDPLTQAQIDQIYLTTGVLDPNEVRQRIGYEQRTNASADVAGPRDDVKPTGPTGKDGKYEDHSEIHEETASGKEPIPGDSDAVKSRSDVQTVHQDRHTTVEVHLGKTVFTPTIKVEQPEVNINVEPPEINVLVENKGDQ